MLLGGLELSEPVGLGYLRPFYAALGAQDWPYTPVCADEFSFIGGCLSGEDDIARRARLAARVLTRRRVTPGHARSLLAGLEGDRECA